MKRFVFLSAFALVSLLSAPLRAQDAGLTDADILFSRDAALGNIAEVELGALAARVSANPRVQAFGQQMVTDHTTLQQQLVQASSASGALLPPTLTSIPPRDVPATAGQSAPSFDGTYIRGQILAHRRSIALYRIQATRGGATALRTFAQQSLPMLRMHLRDARRALASTRGNRGTGGGGATTSTTSTGSSTTSSTSIGTSTTSTTSGAGSTTTASTSPVTTSTSTGSSTTSSTGIGTSTTSTTSGAGSTTTASTSPVTTSTMSPIGGAGGGMSG